MTKKMLAVDLDGTLLNNERKIDKPNIEAVHNLIDRGHYFVIASGRPPYRIEPIINEMGLTNYPTYVVCYNGGQIYRNDTKEILYDEYLPFEIKNEVLKFSYSIGTKNLVYLDEWIISDEIPDHLNFLTKLDVVKVTNDFDYLLTLDRVHKVLMIGTKEELDKAMELIPSSLYEKCSIFRSDNYFLEIMPKGINKGSGVKRISEILGVDINDVYAMGDEGNDLPMIKAVGHGIAVGNATDEIKAAAKEVTITNEEFAVKAIIEKYFL